MNVKRLTIVGSEWTLYVYKLDKLVWTNSYELKEWAIAAFINEMVHGATKCTIEEKVVYK